MKKFKIYIVGLLAVVLFFGFSENTFASVSPFIDSDGDTLRDILEIEVYFTDPYNPDTDGDGYSDGEEISLSYSPHLGDGKMIYENDFDGDGLDDWVELYFGTSIGMADSDGDGKSDKEDILLGESPFSTSTEKIYTQKIVVDLSHQRLYYYVNGIKMQNLPVSTGNPHTPTPVGMFEVERKIDVKRYIGDDYNLPNVWWNLQFKPMYYIHTAYWHNDFGIRTRSHGCVNMRKEDVAGLYKYVDVGVPVEVIGETPYGRVI